MKLSEINSEIHIPLLSGKKKTLCFFFNYQTSNNLIDNYLVFVFYTS